MNKNLVRTFAEPLGGEVDASASRSSTRVFEKSYFSALSLHSNLFNIPSEAAGFRAISKPSL